MHTQKHHFPSRLPRLALAVLSALALGACTAFGTFPPATPTPTPVPHPTAPDALVFRIETTGGLLPPFPDPTALPDFSLYGDGTVITAGPQLLVYPPPILPNLVQSRISEEGIQLLLQEAVAAGLSTAEAEYPLPGAADVPTTVFTLVLPERTIRVSVAGLGLEEPNDPRLASEERETRQRLAGLAERVRDFPTWLPPEAIREPANPYSITRLQLLALPSGEETTTPVDQTFVTVRAWPLPNPLGTLGEPAPWFQPAARCFVVGWSDLALLLAQLRHANTATRWESAGEHDTLLVRPLLPDEQGCQPHR
jgi:hypothetical protein